jgi:hypothetical protein
VDTHKKLLSNFLGNFYFAHGEGPENKNNNNNNNNKNNNTHVYFKERDFGDQRWMDSFP